MSDEIVVESIKKMLNLNMSDEDIIASLVDAGLEYDYAIEMLDEVRNEDTVEKVIEKNTKPKKNLDNIETNDVWEEGTLALINQKLEDLTKKEKKLDEDINNKINAITSKEINKMKAIIDSQRSLLVTKIDMAMANKLKEIKEQVDSTLKTLQDINKNTERKLVDFDNLANNLKDLKENITTQIQVVENIRLSAETILNNIKNKANDEIDDFFKVFEAKAKDITNKTNNTLNLSSKIMDSLVNATQNKLNDYCEKKIDNFSLELQQKLNIDDIKSVLLKINELNNIDTKINSIVDEKISLAMNNVDSKKYDDSIYDLNKRFMNLEKDLNRLMKTNSIDDINLKIDELMKFKDEFNNSNLNNKNKK